MRRREGKGGRWASFFMRMPSAGSAEENPSMTKAVGPKHKSDLWKVHAKSQVFSTAGLSAPPPTPPFFHDLPPSFLFFSLQTTLGLLLDTFFLSNGGDRSVGRKTKRGKNSAAKAGSAAPSRECLFVVLPFYPLCSRRLEVPQTDEGKQNVCSGKISSTCLRWKLVDPERR